MRLRLLPVLGLLLASFVQCVGSDPGATGDGDKDSGTVTTDSGGGGPTDTGGGDVGNDGNTGGDAATDADGGKGPLAWSPLHWGASSPFGPIGTFVGIDASGDTYFAFTFNRATTIAGGALANSGGGADIGIVKLDAAGTVVWKKVYGGSADDTVEDMKVDAAGNVYLVGHFASSSIDFGAKTLTKVSNGDDAFVAKLDTAGTAIAAFDYSTSGNSGGECTRVDVRAGKILVGCYGFGSASIDMQNGSTTTLTAVSGASNAIFALLRDTDMKAAWVNSIGGNLGDSVTGVAFNPSGAIGYVSVNYNLGPVADSNGSISGLGGTGAGALIAKLDLTNGNVSWHVEHPYNGNTDFFFIRDMAAQLTTVVVSGELGGTMTIGGKSLTSAGGRDAAIAAYSVVDGAGSWARRYGGTNDEGAYGLAVDATDHVFAATGYLTNGFAIDGVTVPNACASCRNIVAFEVLATANASAMPWNRLITAVASDASVTNATVASLAVSPTTIVAGGTYRGWLDFGDGQTSASFDPLSNGWDEYAVGWNR